MTFRESLFRLLNRGEVAQDPDELVEIAVLPFALGPMSVDLLRDDGFHATGAPTYNVATEIATDYRVLVPRHEAAAATQRLDEIR